MDTEKINHFKNILLQQKSRHDHILNNMKKNDRGENENYASGELSNYDNHPAELGAELFEVEHNMALEVSEEFHIREIESALKKMDEGNYGICEFCGKDIGEERLEALPYAKLCIECENEKDIEMEYLMNNRPIEEKVIDAPFGRKYLNEQEDDEYEGLDQLNDLMKYGSASTPQDMGGYHDYEEFYTNEIDNQGIVDKMDNISNEEYEEQLPD